MKKLTYRITTKSPIIISESSGDTNMVASSDYISGSAIYGWAANKYIQEKSLGKIAHTDERFHHLFLIGALHFTNAYIVSVDKQGSINGNYPLPQSVQKLKENEKEIVDLLFVENDFDQQTSSIAGFGRLQGANIYKQTVKKSLNFHHQRDKKTGCSEEGKIFNYESLDAGETFEGNILGNEEDLNEFISKVGKENIIYLGRSRNAQYGMASLEIINESLKESSNSELRSGKVTLTLLSNTIIYNENGFSTANVSDLQEILGEDIVIKKSFIKTGDTEGFVSIWKLRKPSERCFLAGSCFLLEVNEVGVNRLKELQKHGIGERRAEGFGSIVFGMQQQDNLTLWEENEKKLLKPSGQIPLIAKDIVVTVAKDFIKKQVELEGLKKTEDFAGRPNQLPSKSLVSRLEAMVKEHGKMQLDTLRKTAKDQLEKCHDKKITLHDFLSHINAKDLLNDVMTKDKEKNIKKLCDEAAFSPVTDQNLLKDLYRIYFISFFSAMRKIIKKKGGKQ